MNKRVALFAILALGITPLCSHAQPAQRVFRIGLLSAFPRDSSAAIVPALREFGYNEGRNTVFDYRFADGKEDRLAALASDMVASKVDLIIAPFNLDALAAKRATTSIPIVMVAASPASAALSITASLSRSYSVNP